MAHKVNPILVLDFETGGLSGQKDAVTEVGMLCVTGDTFTEIGRYSSFIRPYLYNYDPKALTYTNTTLEKLQTLGQDIEVVAKEMHTNLQKWYQETTNSYTKKMCVVGHNIQFDIAFLQQLGKEGKVDWAKFIDGEQDFYGKWYPNYIDTLNFSKLVWGNDTNFTSFKLTNCVEKAGVSIGDAHSALQDVIATKELLINFVNRLRSSDGLGGVGEKKDIRFREGFHFQMPEPQK